MKRTFLVWICLAIIATMNGDGCSRIKETSAVPPKTIEQVLKENTSKWLDIPGVEGTAVGMCNDEPCIRIFASAPPDEIQATIPKVIEGYPVVIDYSGPIRALEP